MLDWDGDGLIFICEDRDGCGTFLFFALLHVIVLDWDGYGISILSEMLLGWDGY